MSRIKRIAVVGGGIGGLAASLELSKSPDVFVTLYEKESQSGGLCSSYRWKDVVCDRFYHVALSSDTETLRLGRDLGLENRLFWRGSSSGFYGSGKLVSMSSAFDFLRFPFLNPVDKLRLGLGILTAVRIRDPQSLSGLTAPVWLTQVFGRRLYERIWEPLLRSKLGEGRFRTSASFMWATINRLYGARDRSRRRETMGGFGRGVWMLAEAAEKELRKRGVEIKTDTAVTGLRWNIGDSNSSAAAPEESPFSEGAGDKRAVMPSPPRFFLRTDETEGEFDRVLLTVPDAAIEKILPPGYFHPFRNRLKETEYLGIVCVLLVLRRPLTPYYVINLLDTDLPFTGVIETTNIYSPEDFGGRSLVYLPRYVLSGDPVLDQSDGEAADRAISSLRTIRPDLEPEDILHSAVFREPMTQALPTINNTAGDRGFETPVPGLFVSNSGLIQNTTLNNDAVLTNIRRVVPLLLKD